jgi:hypothetical protein
VPVSLTPGLHAFGGGDLTGILGASLGIAVSLAVPVFVAIDVALWDSKSSCRRSKVRPRTTGTLIVSASLLDRAGIAVGWWR